jgi:methyltransferase (TIGR00027 family)
MDTLGLTSRWVAAARALESERPDRLFHDPWARRLAGPEGFAVLTEMARATGTTDTAYLAIRTRFLDDFAEHAASTLKQVVILAAGMDARAFRLAWPIDTRLFEVERASVLEVKESILRTCAAEPRCERHVLPIDLTEAWEHALVASGFRADTPALFLLEGLTPYLEREPLEALLARLSALAAPGSQLGADVIGRSFLESPWTAPLLGKLDELQIGWRFGTDEPEQLFASFGWDAKATLVGVPGANFGRWPHSVPARNAPGFPKCYFVQATRSTNRIVTVRARVASVARPAN